MHTTPPRQGRPATPAAVHHLGRAHQVFGAGGLLLVALGACWHGAAGVAADMVAADPALGPSLGVAVAAMVLCFSSGLYAGHALLQGRAWAAWWLRLLGMLYLSLFPIGTVLGLATWWILSRADAPAWSVRSA